MRINQDETKNYYYCIKRILPDMNSCYTYDFVLFNHLFFNFHKKNEAE